MSDQHSADPVLIKDADCALYEKATKELRCPRCDGAWLERLGCKLVECHHCGNYFYE